MSCFQSKSNSFWVVATFLSPYCFGGDLEYINTLSVLNHFTKRKTKTVRQLWRVSLANCMCENGLIKNKRIRAPRKIFGCKNINNGREQNFIFAWNRSHRTSAPLSSGSKGFNSTSPLLSHLPRPNHEVYVIFIILRCLRRMKITVLLYPYHWKFELVQFEMFLFYWNILPQECSPECR